VVALVAVPVVGGHDRQPLLRHEGVAAGDRVEQLADHAVDPLDRQTVLSGQWAGHVSGDVDTAEVDERGVAALQALDRGRGHPLVLDEVAVLLAVARHEGADLRAERAHLGQRRPVHRGERGATLPGEPGEEVRVQLVTLGREGVVEHAVLVRPDPGCDRRPTGPGVGAGTAGHVEQARREHPVVGQRGQARSVAAVDPVPAQTVDPDHQGLEIDHAGQRKWPAARRGNV
jgi:hypothetical protein